MLLSLLALRGVYASCYPFSRHLSTLRFPSATTSQSLALDFSCRTSILPKLAFRFSRLLGFSRSLVTCDGHCFSYSSRPFLPTLLRTALVIPYRGKLTLRHRRSSNTQTANCRKTFRPSQLICDFRLVHFRRFGFGWWQRRVGICILQIVEKGNPFSRSSYWVENLLPTS